MRPPRLHTSTASIRFLLAGVVLLTASCGSPAGPTPPPPPPNAPRLTCPSDIKLPSPMGMNLNVDFPAPVAQDGSPPLTITCTPSSGSSFSLGRTTIGCLVSDALQRTATCTFNVDIEGPPQLSSTRFVAFGDSITEGKIRDAFSFSFDFPDSYPDKLSEMLAARYTAQQIVVINEGLGGEAVQGPDRGELRLSKVLATDRPEELLLQEGANDLITGDETAIPGLVSGLRAMIRDARGHGVHVFVGTLLPQRPGLPKSAGAALIAPANAQIRPMVESEGAVLVDLNGAFGSDIASLIGPDGLHPTVAGYQLIAKTFFDAIRTRLEKQPQVQNYFIRRNPSGTLMIGSR